MGFVSKENLKAFAAGLRNRLYYPVGATFTVDGWTAVTGGYTQTKTVTKTSASTGGAFTPKSIFPPVTTKTNVAATDAAKRRALAILANGTTEITVGASSATMKVTVTQKPACDIDVKWYLER